MTPRRQHNSEKILQDVLGNLLGGDSVPFLLCKAFEIIANDSKQVASHWGQTRRPSAAVEKQTGRKKEGAER